MYQSLLIKMLDVQKNMRHDIMNDIQVIYGYLQLNHPEKAMKYSQQAVKRMQGYQQLGRIPLPLLQSFLTWFVSQFSNDGNAPLEINLSGDWNYWQTEDEELTQLFMALLCSVQEGFLNGSITCTFTFTKEAPSLSLLFEGTMESLHNLTGFTYCGQKLVWDRTEIASGGLLITINKSGHVKR
ncbi:MAG: Spo0B domain-containing protein [Peptococcia bacterium]